MDAVQLQEWLAQRGKKEHLLYERFGRTLEPEHNGEFVAIADDGRTILGKDELAVARRALQEFGRGAFALRRIGARAEIRWLCCNVEPMNVGAGHRGLARRPGTVHLIDDKPLGLARARP